jgi:predicted nucleic acid-binding protein
MCGARCGRFTGGERPWRPLLPDPNDDFVLEFAVESRADFLVTFNTRDFVGAGRFGIRVISPLELLATMGEAL